MQGFFFGRVTPDGTPVIEQVVPGAPVVAATLAVCTLEQFGGGNGSPSDDQAALITALSQMGAGKLYNALQLGAKEYTVTGGTLPAGCSLLGYGDASILRTTTDAPVIVIGGEDWTVQGVTFLGNSTGTHQIGIANGPVATGLGYTRGRILNCTFDSLGQAGVLCYNPNNAIAQHRGTVISTCRVRNCPTYGLWLVMEYVEVLGCTISENGDGIFTNAGNLLIADCVIGDNTAGIHLNGGGNDGHGTVVGCEVNHNTTNLLVDTVALANGMQFVGCNFYVGAISLTNTHGIRFVGCSFDANGYTFNNSQGTVFDACLFPGSLANAIVNSNSPTTAWNNPVDLSGLVPSFIYAGYVASPAQLRVDGQVVVQATTVGAAAVTVDAFYTPPNGKASKLDILVNALDDAVPATYSVDVDASVRQFGGAPAVAGTPVAFGGTGDAALSTVAVALSFDATGLAVTVTPPAAYAGTLHWLVAFTTTENAP